MTMSLVYGNLLEMADNGDFDIICHGANCFHTMASGIAGQIVRKWPEVALADKQTDYGSRKKLGSYSEVDIVGKTSCGFKVINAYTQFSYGSSRDVFEYAAFETFLNRLCGKVFTLNLLSGKPIRIGFPMIGCGLAGGNPVRILSILDKFAEDVSPFGDVTIVKFVES